MKVAATSTGPGLDADFDPRFGRCGYFLFIDTEPLTVEYLENPNTSLSGGAGIACVQLMIDRSVSTLLTGECGPKAQRALAAAGIEVVTGCSGPIAARLDRLIAEGRGRFSDPPGGG